MRIFAMRSLGLALPLWLVCSAVPAWAGQWHYSGFVSQSVINTSDNNFFGRSDDALNTDFRELALILRGSPLESIEVSAQLLSRTAGTADDGSPRLDYAFASWRFMETADVTQGFSLGKIKVPYGFSNETRESPFGRQRIWISQGLYPDRARNSHMTANELLYFGEFRNEFWTFGLKTGYGKSKPDPDELTDYFDVNVSIDRLGVSSSTKWNTQLTAEYDGGHFRAALSRENVPIAFDTRLRFSPTLALDLSAEVKTYITALSLEWNEPSFSFTFEADDSSVNYGGIRVKYNEPDYRNYPQGAYLEFRYHSNPKWDVFTRYDVVVFDKNDSTGKSFEKDTGIPAYTRFAYDKVLGAVYRPAPDWLLMAELHRVNGTIWGTGRDMPDNESVKQYWNIAAFSVAWRF